MLKSISNIKINLLFPHFLPLDGAIIEKVYWEMSCDVSEPELLERVNKLRLPKEEEELLLRLVEFSEEVDPGTGKKVLDEYERL